MMRIPENYIKLREQCGIQSVSFGLCNIFVFHVEELEAAQRGYIVSNENGSWRKEWLVIGYEDLCGDPIFMDTNTTEFTVFTAAHGEGEWNPILIASSFTNFINIFRLLTEDNSETVFETILNENPSVEVSFWKSVVD